MAQASSDPSASVYICALHSAKNEETNKYLLIDSHNIYRFWEKSCSKRGLKHAQCQNVIQFSGIFMLFQGCPQEAKLNSQNHISSYRTAVNTFCSQLGCQRSFLIAENLIISFSNAWEPPGTSLFPGPGRSILPGRVFSSYFWVICSGTQISPLLRCPDSSPDSSPFIYDMLSFLVKNNWGKFFSTDIHFGNEIPKFSLIFLEWSFWACIHTIY